ncbi:hypothetical protein Lal_00042086 [Lupinus albus]|nr:hypothetical protein Lal_00042086 [Lupinus albus]
MFDQIPMSYTDLFAYLQRHGIVTLIPRRILENPGPWHNENAKCAYHSEVVGHMVEDCRAFKFKVQDLFNAKRIDFRETTPSITGNPLPNHGDQGVNAIDENGRVATTDRVEEVKMPMGFIFKEMCRQGLIEVVIHRTSDDSLKICEMHGHVDHTLEECKEFKSLLQK